MRKNNRTAFPSWEGRAAFATRRSCDSPSHDFDVMPPQADKPRRRGLGGALLFTAQARWKKLRGAVLGIHRAIQLAAKDKQEFQESSKAAIQSAIAGQSDVHLAVSAKDLASINYNNQGNADLYTAEALAERHRIRTDPVMIDAVKAWWRWLPKPKQTNIAAGMSKAAVIEPVYSAMVVLLQLVLLPRFGMEADEDYDPSEDWEADCKGEDIMLYPNFFDALFELADMWCDTVAAKDYAQLLSSLLEDAQKLEEHKGTFRNLMLKFGFDAGNWPDGNEQNDDDSADDHGNDGEDTQQEAEQGQLQDWLEMEQAVGEDGRDTGEGIEDVLPDEEPDMAMDQQDMSDFQGGYNHTNQEEEQGPIEDEETAHVNTTLDDDSSPYAEVAMSEALPVLVEEFTAQQKHDPEPFANHLDNLQVVESPDEDSAERTCSPTPPPSLAAAARPSLSSKICPPTAQVLSTSTPPAVKRSHDGASTQQTQSTSLPSRPKQAPRPPQMPAPQAAPMPQSQQPVDHVGNGFSNVHQHHQQGVGQGSFNLPDQMYDGQQTLWYQHFMQNLVNKHKGGPGQHDAHGPIPQSYPSNSYMNNAAPQGMGGFSVGPRQQGGPVSQAKHHAHIFRGMPSSLPKYAKQTAGGPQVNAMHLGGTGNKTQPYLPTRNVPASDIMPTVHVQPTSAQADQALENLHALSQLGLDRLGRQRGKSSIAGWADTPPLVLPSQYPPQPQPWMQQQQHEQLQQQQPQQQQQQQQQLPQPQAVHGRRAGTLGLTVSSLSGNQANGGSPPPELLYTGDLTPFDGFKVAGALPGERSLPAPSRAYKQQQRMPPPRTFAMYARNAGNATQNNAGWRDVPPGPEPSESTTHIKHSSMPTAPDGRSHRPPVSIASFSSAAQSCLIFQKQPPGQKLIGHGKVGGVGFAGGRRRGPASHPLYAAPSASNQYLTNATTVGQLRAALNHPASIGLDQVLYKGLAGAGPLGRPRLAGQKIESLVMTSVKMNPGVGNVGGQAGRAAAGGFWQACR